MLLGDVLPWLRELTGIGLYETIDMTCAKYDYTGCHGIVSRDLQYDKILTSLSRCFAMSR